MRVMMVISGRVSVPSSSRCHVVLTAVARASHTHTAFHSRPQGYIDLSKRRVSPEDVAKCEDRYNKAKAVHSVLRHVADLRGLVLEDLSTKVSWPLYKKYGHAFDAFKLTLQDEEDVFVGLDIDEETKQAMITHIKRRLAPQPSKVRFLSFLCFCFTVVCAPSPFQPPPRRRACFVP